MSAAPQISFDELPKELSIMDFILKFDEEFCREYLFNKIFPNGKICCAHCGNTKVYKTSLKGKTRYRCADPFCRKDFFITSFTIFKNSKINLKDCFFIVHQISSNKKNKSSVQWGKDLGITQKTAWGIRKKIREQLTQDFIKLSGTVEVDEAFISKSKHRYHNNWGAMSTRKAPIIGLIERQGKVVVKKVPNRTKDTLNNLILRHVEKGSTVYTDAWHGYKDLNKLGFVHDFVNHSAREYVREEVHTNYIENFWSILKRSIRGAHHQVSDKHLQGYIDEVVFKFNHRHLSQMEKFDLILQKCIL